jgi:hypothetical protein
VEGWVVVVVAWWQCECWHVKPCVEHSEVCLRALPGKSQERAL